jgi:hypothetical protein
MLSAALLEARRRGAQPYPILRIPWVARGYQLGTDIISPRMRETPAGQVTRISKIGGWSQITYGSGIGSSELKIVETKVSVLDARGELYEMLTAYDPRGSAALMDWAAPGLVVDDWTPLFRGVVADWARVQDSGDAGPCTEIFLKTDDTVLRSPIPGGTIQRTEWGSAEEGSVFGTQLHLVTGVQDSSLITGRGMVRAPNLVYDETLGYKYLASVGNFVNVRRIAYDGIVQGSGWTFRSFVHGRVRVTMIEIAAGFQPSKGVVVSFDCEGADENGLDVGTALTGAPDTLRMIINEYGFRQAPLRGYRGDAPVIEAESWDESSALFALWRIECARTFGGEQEPESLDDLIRSYLDAYPIARILWTPLGQLRHGVLDPDDVDPDDDRTLDVAAHHEGGLVPMSRGDKGEVYNRVHTSYCFSSGEQKFLSAYDAHDLGTLPDERVEKTIENTWSQGRFEQDTDLNPAPPDDPEIPS